MKKFFYLLCTITGLSALNSCSNDITEDVISQKKIKLNQNEVLSISYDETKDLDDKTLFNMVNSFAELQGGNVTRSNVASFKIVKESFINKEGEFKEQEQATRAISNDDITSKICEIEFSNGSSIGRAVVSANANFPGIIAFIPQCSSETMLKQTGASELLHASKASYLYNTIKMKELVDSLRLPTLEKVSKELKLPLDEISYEAIKDNIVITDAKPITRATAVQIGDIEMQIQETSIYPPLVKTNWGQGFPYNAEFGYFNELLDWVRTEKGGKNFTTVPAGCVNIAMAQMMTYTHRRRIPQISFPNPDGHGTFIPNWDLMAQTPKIDDPGASERGRSDTEELIIDLYRENHTTSKKDWDGAVIASEVTEENMLRTMSKYFNYKPKASFNGDMAWAALRAKRLIMMLTSDHAFIISGMLITEKSIATRQLVKSNDVYWHANLGWADECTGYYQLDSNANTYFDAKGVQQWCYKMDYLNNISVR
ncbi:C10 family peptidase [Bacteroides faecium]|uniref:Spi protease inhibitor domain-containing protein n=1 Tax=Bacteroides faecium TaxID=2715212 RepID=A0A6H0KKU6_9BACE|nr:C10 family peptidase [Bacteroides faecium]QIU93839.1 hypothetical protein BacF7301_06620 [Bacteroides faecium]